MSILGYGLVLFGTIAVALIVYVLVMITWRSSRYHLANQGTTNPAEQMKRVSLNLDPYSASTFKYRKGIESTETPSFSERKCTVCLSDFEDEEYVRQLSQCRHSFHAPCIDMWMYYHSDCPLCRTPIHRLASSDGGSARESSQLASDDGGSTREFTMSAIGNSMDGLLNIRISS